MSVNGQFLVIITCLDNVSDRRTFLLDALKRGYVSDEFVYIFAEFLPDKNQSEYWVDHSEVPDGRDEEARKAFEKSLIVSAMLFLSKLSIFLLSHSR